MNSIFEKVAGLRPQSARVCLFSVAIILVTFSAETKAAAAAPSTPDEVVAMPAFVVADTRDRIRWRYVSHPEFEILANCSDKVLTGLSKRISEALPIADLIVPPHLRLRSKVPMMLIIDQPPLQLTPDGKGNNFIVLHQEPYADPDSFIAYLSYREREESLGPGSRSLAWSLHPLLIPMLRNATPRAALWLQRAVEVIIPSMWVSGTKLHVSPVRPLDGPKRELVPLDQLARTLEATDLASPMPLEERKIVSHTARLFVHWALFAEDGKYRERFWDFYQRSGLVRVADESLFRECLGLSYAEVQERLNEYRGKTNVAYEELLVDFKKSLLPSEPATPFRDARPEEIARIAAEWSRIAALSLPKDQGRLRAAAAKAFERALAGPNAHEPRLVAAAGIFLTQIDRDSAARRYLQESTAAGVIRPQAYLQLARIRLAEAKGSLVQGETLTDAQRSDILGLLDQSYAQSSQQEDYYKILLEVLTLTPPGSEPARLSRLLDGAKRFPRNLSFILRTATLQARLGFKEDAKTLCLLGLEFATDESDRQSLLALQSTLF